jgi:hypothetical protein
MKRFLAWLNALKTATSAIREGINAVKDLAFELTLLGLFLHALYRLLVMH